VKDHTNSLIVRDFKEIKADGVWKVIYVPFGEGMIDFIAQFDLPKKCGINVPVSRHCEYELGGEDQ